MDRDGFETPTKWRGARWWRWAIVLSRRTDRRVGKGNAALRWAGGARSEGCVGVRDWPHPLRSAATRCRDADQRPRSPEGPRTSRDASGRRLSRRAWPSKTPGSQRESAREGVGPSKDPFGHHAIPESLQPAVRQRSSAICPRPRTSHQSDHHSLQTHKEPKKISPGPVSGSW